MKNLLHESELTFTKQLYVPCMAHVLNLDVQGGLKELSNSSLTSLCSESEGDEECEEDDISYFTKTMWSNSSLVSKTCSCSK